MFKNVKWVRLTPDRPGRGGIKSGFHTFPQEPINDIQSSTGVHIYQGAWRRSYDSTAYPVVQHPDPGANTGVCTALHGYVYPSLTDPAAQPNVTVIGHTLGNPNAHFWDFTNGAIRSLRPPTTYQAAVFNTINQRCFGGDGQAEATIMDDRTPAIHAQPNQNLGIMQPTQPMPQTSGGFTGAPNTTPLGTAYAHYQSQYLNHPNPNNPLRTCIVGDYVGGSAINGTYPYFAGSFGGFTLTVAAQTSNVTAFTATGTISITTGTSLVTLSGATWPVNYKYAGLAINFNGYSFVIATHGWTGISFTDYDINGNSVGAPGTTQLYIQGIYTGPTLTNVPYTITGCQVTLNPASVATFITNNGGTLGYSQSTNCMLFQVYVSCSKANGQYRGLGNINLGSPLGTQVHTVADGRMPNNAYVLQSASALFRQTDVGLTIVIDGAVAANGILSTTITQWTANTYITVAAPNTSGGALTSAKCMWGQNISSVSDAAIAAGFLTTLTSASNPWTAGNVGDTIMIAGAGNAGGTVALVTTITGYTSPGVVTIGAACAVVAGITAKQAFWQDALAGSTTGPTYAYAWYDPETAHMSNVSPLYTVPKPTGVPGQYTDFTNLTPVFQVDPGYISYPDPTVDGIRFSHIVFFRTLSTGGSTLYPIGSLQPYVGKVTPGQASTRGSWNPQLLQGWYGLPNGYTAIYDPVAHTAFPAAPTVWYDFSSDSDLILAGGFQAPQYTNSKPLVTLRGGITQPGWPYQMAYWDRRLWLVNTQEPDKLVFSCDDAQCPLGIPEESFPATNFLRLPGVDGRVIGLRTVGDMLLVTTERWAYIIAGNNESNYRLMKVSSAMPGVGTYQMDEFPTYSGAEGEPTTLFYLGRDWKVYQWTVGGQVVPISAPIQNMLDALKKTVNSYSIYVQMRVHCISAWGRRFLTILAPYPNFGGYGLHYDIDSQVWTWEAFTDDGGANYSVPPTAMATVYGLNPPVNELYAIFSQVSNQIIIRSWVRDDTTTSSTFVNLVTFPMTFDGKKTRKRLVAVNIHGTAGPWTANVITNESSSSLVASASFGPYPDPLDSVYAQDFAGTDQDSVIMAGQFYASKNSMPVVGYRFTLSLSRFDTIPAKLYAIDIGYVDDEEPGEGDV